MNSLFSALKKLIVFLFLTLGVGTVQLLACSCNFITIEKAVKITPVIFHGEVVSVTKVPLSETFEIENISDLHKRLTKSEVEWFTNQAMINQVEFESCTFLKGKADESCIVIYTPISGASCGFRFLEEETYIVYADYNNFFSNILALDDVWDVKAKTNIHWTSLCTRNTTAVEEEEVEIVNEIIVGKSFFRKTFRAMKRNILNNAERISPTS